MPAVRGMSLDDAQLALDEAKLGYGEEIARFGLLRPLLREFAGMRGSLLYGGLRSGGVLYLARRYQRV